MTPHYFEHPLVSLHYYKFGAGDKKMLCFHGFGMHGRQFRWLEDTLGEQYTFYGFDLFFHENTLLRDNSLYAVKKGISKQTFASLITAFCEHEQIDRFSVIGYSMGSHYATIVTEELPERIDEYIVAAPSCLRPGALITYFSINRIGNKLMEKLALSEKALFRLLNGLKALHIIDDEARSILTKEVATAELRFNFYACFTYLRFFKTDQEKLIAALSSNHIRSFFIFGKKDRMYPPSIGSSFFAKFKPTKVVLLDESHDLINERFASTLAGLLS